MAEMIGIPKDVPDTNKVRNRYEKYFHIGAAAPHKESNPVYPEDCISRADGTSKSSY